MLPVNEIRCSKLDRVMNCAGVLRFKDLFEAEAGEPAREGTACGELLQFKLESGDAKAVPPSANASNGFRFDRDMHFHASEVATEILGSAQSKVLCETRIDWTTRSGIVIRGQYDGAYVRGNNLHIDDLKYGWKIVDAHRNWQLIGYAIGEVIRRGVAFEYIVMRILQPRAHHEDGPYRTFAVTYAELLALKEEIEQRMMLIANGFQELRTGKHCKYCPAVAESCTAFNRAFHASLDYVLGDFKQDSTNPKEMAFQLDLIHQASDIIEIKKKSLTDLVTDKIKNGGVVPGWTTVQNYGDRKWNGDATPDFIELMTGKSVVKQDMLSPAQVEKLGVSKSLVAKLSNRYLIGMKLKRQDSADLGDKIFGNTEPIKKET